MDEKLLRRLISEMVLEAIEELDEEEELDEFSGVGAVAGYALPLGMEPKVKKNRKLGEDYETSIEKLASSFGGAESPFGKKGAGSRNRVIQFLTPKV